MTDSMIDRVADSLATYCKVPPSIEMADVARAILTAIREPTKAMIQAPLLPWREGVGPADLYKIMIDAALEDGRQ